MDKKQITTLLADRAVKVKNSSPPPTVGRLLADRLPTDYRQTTNSLPTAYRQVTDRLPTVGNLKKIDQTTRLPTVGLQSAKVF